MTATPNPRTARILRLLAASLGAAALMAVAPASGSAILTPDRPDSVMEPVVPSASYEIEVTQNRRLGPEATLRLLDLHASGSRDLRSATVFWGDGTTSSRTLQAGASYDRLTFPVHSYSLVMERRYYDVAVQVTDSAGGVKQKGYRLGVAPWFRVRLSPITFKAVSDCDWVGEGDFEFKNYQSGRVESFDLGDGDSITVVDDGYATRVVLGDSPFFRYWWIEDDPAWLEAWPGADGANGISLRPGTEAHTQRTLSVVEQEPSQSDCWARLSYTVSMDVLPD